MRKAYAKINLGLDVIGRRPNGYHDVKMIMQTVNIYDELSFEKKATEGVTMTVDNEEIPTGDDNLIVRAAKLLMEEFAVKEGLHIHLKKNIPMAAGMAGGSTDGACTMKAVNELFSLGLSEKELMERGVKLGADIPYCIMGGTALSEGIGEILTPLVAPPEAFLVVAKPDINVSTKYVYENLHLDTLEKHPDIDGMVEAIKAGDLQGICERLDNVLATVTEEKYPIICELKQMMKAHGAMNALMSGSGPTVFGIFDSEDQAKEAYQAIKEADLVKQLFVTTFIDPSKE